MSAASRSNRSDQSWKPLATSVSCAVTRSRVAGRSHAAFEDVAHGEQAGDLRQVPAFLAGPKCRGPGRDADAGDADERVHDLLGHPLAEIFLVLRRRSCPRTAAPRSRRRRACCVGSCGGPDDFQPGLAQPVDAGAPRTRAPTTSRIRSRAPRRSPAAAGAAPARPCRPHRALRAARRRPPSPRGSPSDPEGWP